MRHLFLDTYLPWFLWRRLVWVSVGSGRIQSRVTQYVPIWRVRTARRHIEARPEFSNWYTAYPDGTKVRTRPRRPRKRGPQPQPTADDLRWLSNIARERGLINDDKENDA